MTFACLFMGDSTEAVGKMITAKADVNVTATKKRKKANETKITQKKRGINAKKSSPMLIDLLTNEKDNVEFQNAVKQIFAKMNQMQHVAHVRTNMYHFGAYIMWRLEHNCGNSYTPRKGECTKVHEIAGKYSDWFREVVSVPKPVYDYILRKGDSLYWLYYVKNHIDDELVQEILQILPMFSESIDKMKAKQGN